MIMLCMAFSNLLLFKMYFKKIKMWNLVFIQEM